MTTWCNPRWVFARYRHVDIRILNSQTISIQIIILVGIPAYLDYKPFIPNKKVKIELIIPESTPAICRKNKKKKIKKPMSPKDSI
jgi:hypothetical protein